MKLFWKSVGKAFGVEGQHRPLDFQELSAAEFTGAGSAAKGRAGGERITETRLVLREGCAVILAIADAPPRSPERAVWRSASPIRGIRRQKKPCLAEARQGADEKRG
ncbi:MAG: hypothetical protein LBQ12_11675 [Deltaproteobacteria bacterium]|jgi:hypothetical protein|nr:hypothetical protein [Deltaproteobacteria bacterium]